eukprot:2158814-Pyramimonas_sp.AAC.1
MAIACSTWPRRSIAPAGAATSNQGSGARILRGAHFPHPARPQGGTAKRLAPPAADRRQEGLQR